MWLKTWKIVDHVSSLDLDAMWSEGLRGFIFDLDNTIMPPGTGTLPDDVAKWLEAASVKGFKMVVVSNNPMQHYTQAAEKTLNMPVIGSAAKPRRGSLRRAMEMMALDPHQVAVIGDRPLTDIWGGIRIGAKTILVDPLNKRKENRLFKCLRWLERLVVRQ